MVTYYSNLCHETFVRNITNIQLFQLTLSDQSFKPTRQDRMVVWVEVEGCSTCRILIKYNDFLGFSFSLDMCESEDFYATVNLKGNLANKSTQ